MARSNGDVAGACTFSSNMMTGALERDCTTIADFRVMQPTDVAGVCSFSSNMMTGVGERDCATISNFRVIQPTNVAGICTFSCDMNGVCTRDCSTINMMGNTAAGNPHS